MCNARALPPIALVREPARVTARARTGRGCILRDGRRRPTTARRADARHQTTRSDCDTSTTRRVVHLWTRLGLTSVLASCEADPTQSRLAVAMRGALMKTLKAALVAVLITMAAMGGSVEVRRPMQCRSMQCPEPVSCELRVSLPMVPAQSSSMRRGEIHCGSQVARAPRTL